MAVFQDDFNDGVIDSAKWNTVSSGDMLAPSETGGELRLTAKSTYSSGGSAGINSVPTMDFTGKKAEFFLTDALAMIGWSGSFPSGGTVVAIKDTGGNNQVAWYVDQTEFGYRIRNAGVNSDTTAVAFSIQGIRLQHNTPANTWTISTWDGSSWTVRRTTSAASWNPTAVKVYFEAYVYGSNQINVDSRCTSIVTDADDNSSVSVSVSETADFTESISTIAQIDLSQTGLGTESLSPSATISCSESGLGTEGLVVYEGFSPLVDESGLGDEELIVSVGQSPIVDENTSPYEEILVDVIQPPPVVVSQPEVLRTGYNNISSRMIAEINRGELFYLAVELYKPNQDDIFLYPEEALYRFSSSLFTWRNRTYYDRILRIPDMAKFIGKQFNNFAFELANVARGTNSGSAFVFNNIIRGFRIAVRIVFPNLGDCLQDTRLVWWGRISHVEEVNEQSVRIVCSQEIGDFSYEVGTDKFGAACPLWFGKGECLGNETLEQKSPLYRAAFQIHGQGGCNRTIARCKELSNDRFYQGQNVVTVTGQFIRTEIVKKKILWIFTIKKKNRIPVQWSSKNQSENDDVNIPIVLGRARVILHAFTWADIGTSIIALMGACKGESQGMYNITSHNPDLPIGDVTVHLGELGGVGSQQPDPRFPDSGYNSRLTYAGVTFTNSTDEDEPEEVPDVTAVVKGALVRVAKLSPVNSGSTGGVVPPVIIPPSPIPLPDVPPPDPGPGGGGGGGDPFPGGGDCPRLDQWVLAKGDYNRPQPMQVGYLDMSHELWNPISKEFEPIVHIELLKNQPIWCIATYSGAVGFASASHPIIRSLKDTVGTRMDCLSVDDYCVLLHQQFIASGKIETIVCVGFGDVMSITLKGDRIYAFGNTQNQMIVCHNNKEPLLDLPQV